MEVKFLFWNRTSVVKKRTRRKRYETPVCGPCILFVVSGSLTRPYCYFFCAAWTHHELGAPGTDQSKGRLALLDCGLMASVQQEDMDTFVSAVIHLSNRDYKALVCAPVCRLFPIPPFPHCD